MDQELLARAKETGEAALHRGVLLSAAESCTGGLIAAACTHWPGSSQWFCRGIVCYSNQAKMELLGVSRSILQEHGAVSEQTAAAMCQGAGEYSLSVTGIAGPAADGSKPVGMVCFGWRINDKLQTQTQNFQGDRESVRHQSACYALQTLNRLLRSSSDH